MLYASTCYFEVCAFGYLSDEIISNDVGVSSYTDLMNYHKCLAANEFMISQHALEPLQE